MYIHRLTLFVIFLHNLKLGEIEKCQQRDTRLDVQSPFARPNITSSISGIFKD